MEGLESMRDFVLNDHIKKSDEELVAIMSILSQINLILNRFFYLIIIILLIFVMI